MKSLTLLACVLALGIVGCKREVPVQTYNDRPLQPRAVKTMELATQTPDTNARCGRAPRWTECGHGGKVPSQVQAAD